MDTENLPGLTVGASAPPDLSKKKKLARTLLEKLHLN
jgi:hypothetical protein